MRCRCQGRLDKIASRADADDEDELYMYVAGARTMHGRQSREGVKMSKSQCQ